MNAGPHTLTDADAALARWRERLAAASRNVVELSELPAFLALKARPGAGQTAEAARALVATMDELWQGVLLIGAAIDRAATARQGGSRLWRGDDAATEAMAILEGESIEIATGELPVLNRGLLASARAAIRVTPQHLLDAMEQAFERAKASIDTLSSARDEFDAAHAQLAGEVAALAAEGWPDAADAQARLDAARDGADPLGALVRIAALGPAITAAATLAAAARMELEAARSSLSGLAALHARLEATAASCHAATDAMIAMPDTADLAELTSWLDRLARTRQSGQLGGFRVGLSRWRELAARLRRDDEAALAAAASALARRDELRGHFGALRAKQAARDARTGGPDAAADAAAHALQAALFGGSVRLREAERLMSAYEAVLAQPASRSATG